MLHVEKGYFIYKKSPFLPSSYLHHLKHQDMSVQVACPAFRRLGDLVDQVDKVVWSRFLVVKKCTKDSDY